MFVPEGYASLCDAIGCVALMREPEAVATLTPDGFAFFARLDRDLRRRPTLPATAVPAVVAGDGKLRASPSPARDLHASEPIPLNSEDALEDAEHEIQTIKRWDEARCALTKAQDNARVDLRQALISGTVRAAAVRDDGNLVTMQPAGWRLLFARRDDAWQEAGWSDYWHRPTLRKPPARSREPFAEALEGRAVPVAAAPNGNPTAWGHPIIARADLARWCGAPPEPEPAERPADWPAPALTPANGVPTASPWEAAPPGWATLDALPQAVASLTQAPVDAAAAVLRPVLETGALAWRWIGGHPPHLHLAGGGISYGYPAGVRFDDGRPRPDWPALFSPAGAETRRSIEVDVPAAVAAVRGALPQADDCQASEPAKGPAATPSAPEPAGQPAPVYSKAALRAWYRLHVSTWPESHPTPSEADDIAAAAAHFRRDIPRDPFRAIRRELAPEAWKKPGPRSKRG